MGKPIADKGLDSYILTQIANGVSDVAVQTAKAFGLSRQAINKRLRGMVARGLITAAGSTKARRYTLVVAVSTRNYQISPTLLEDEVWREFARPQLEGIPSNVLGICQYGFTEMVNNAIDHSEGGIITCKLTRSPLNLELTVTDDGVGIFRKLKENLKLDDERHAVLELSKGKLTTDPARHTGEGIFFSSRMFDTFSILSGTLYFSHSPADRDWLLEDAERVHGTGVWMAINPASTKTTAEVMNRYSSLGGDYLFTITHVPVGLARYGDENLISRSQAKRLMARVEKFREVVLDFAGVNTIGQAFADEIFRVFQQLHPDVKLRWFHTNAEVEAMITRAIAQKDTNQLSAL